MKQTFKAAVLLVIIIAIIASVCKITQNIQEAFAACSTRPNVPGPAAGPSGSPGAPGPSPSASGPSPSPTPRDPIVVDPSSEISSMNYFKRPRPATIPEGACGSLAPPPASSVAISYDGPSGIETKDYQSLSTVDEFGAGGAYTNPGPQGGGAANMKYIPDGSRLLSENKAWPNGFSKLVEKHVEVNKTKISGSPEGLLILNAKKNEAPGPVPDMLCVNSCPFDAVKNASYGTKSHSEIKGNYDPCVAKTNDIYNLHGRYSIMNFPDQCDFNSRNPDIFPFKVIMDVYTPRRGKYGASNKRDANGWEWSLPMDSPFLKRKCLRFLEKEPNYCELRFGNERGDYKVTIHDDSMKGLKGGTVESEQARLRKKLFLKCKYFEIGHLRKFFIVLDRKLCPFMGPPKSGELDTNYDDIKHSKTWGATLVDHRTLNNLSQTSLLILPYKITEQQYTTITNKNLAYKVGNDWHIDLMDIDTAFVQVQPLYQTNNFNKESQLMSFEVAIGKHDWKSFWFSFRADAWKTHGVEIGETGSIHGMMLCFPPQNVDHERLTVENNFFPEDNHPHTDPRNIHYLMDITKCMAMDPILNQPVLGMYQARDLSPLISPTHAVTKQWERQGGPNAIPILPHIKDVVDHLNKIKGTNSENTTTSPFVADNRNEYPDYITEKKGDPRDENNPFQKGDLYNYGNNCPLTFVEVNDSWAKLDKELDEALFKQYGMSPAIPVLMGHPHITVSPYSRYVSFPNVRIIEYDPDGVPHEFPTSIITDKSTLTVPIYKKAFKGNYTLVKIDPSRDNVQNRYNYSSKQGTAITSTQTEVTVQLTQGLNVFVAVPPDPSTIGSFVNRKMLLVWNVAGANFKVHMIFWTVMSHADSRSANIDIEPLCGGAGTAPKAGGYGTLRVGKQDKLVFISNFSHHSLYDVPAVEYCTACENIQLDPVDPANPSGNIKPRLISGSEMIMPPGNKVRFDMNTFNDMDSRYKGVIVVDLADQESARRSNRSEVNGKEHRFYMCGYGLKHDPNTMRRATPNESEHNAFASDFCINRGTGSDAIPDSQCRKSCMQFEMRIHVLAE